MQSHLYNPPASNTERFSPHLSIRSSSQTRTQLQRTCPLWSLGQYFHRAVSEYWNKTLCRLAHSRNNPPSCLGRCTTTNIMRLRAAIPSSLLRPRLPQGTAGCAARVLESATAQSVQITACLAGGYQKQRILPSPRPIPRSLLWWETEDAGKHVC